MSEATYYQKIRQVILDRANKYYHDNTEKLRENAKSKYNELSEEEQDIKREYVRNRYNNMSEKKKQRLREYQRNYRKAKKTTNFFLCIFVQYIKWEKN